MTLIAQVGNFKPSHSTESHISATLEQMGHQVIRLQEDTFDWSPPQCDFLLWTKTWALDKDAQSLMLKELESNNIPTVALHLDRYWDLNREHQIFDEPWWQSRFVFSADGGNQDRFAAAGINHFWLRPGVYEPECVPGTPNDRFRRDVAFVGSYKTYHAEWPWRQELIDWLHKAYRHRFRLWPRGRAIRGQDLNDLYASVKVIVGDSIFADRARSYWSDRSYETLGRGGFLIHPRVEGFERDFDEDTHLVLYDVGDFNGLREKIDYYLTHADERRQIQAAGHLHVRTRHTYRHRMAEMLSVMNGGPSLSSLATVRPGTLDGAVAREVLDENVYRFEPWLLPNPAVVVDIGANVGTFSMLAGSYGAKVIAVEPFEENLELLRANLAPFDVQIVAGAAGHTGEVVFTPGQGVGRSTGGQTQPGKGIQSLSLPELMAQFNLRHIDFLKVDCEGCEYALLEDAPLDKIGRISMEFHPKDDLLGGLLMRLAAYGHVEIHGRPQVGGIIHWRHF